MNRTQLVNEISSRIDVKKKDVEAVLTALPEVVKEAVASGEDVKLTGFLAFSKKDIPAKSGVSKLKGIIKEWSTEATTQMSVKLSKSYKNL